MTIRTLALGAAAILALGQPTLVSAQAVPPAAPGPVWTPSEPRPVDPATGQPIPAPAPTEPMHEGHGPRTEPLPPAGTVPPAPHDDEHEEMPAPPPPTR